MFAGLFSMARCWFRHWKLTINIKVIVNKLNRNFEVFNNKWPKVKVRKNKKSWANEWKKYLDCVMKAWSMICVRMIDPCFSSRESSPEMEFSRVKVTWLFVRDVFDRFVSGDCRDFLHNQIQHRHDDENSLELPREWLIEFRCVVPDILVVQPIENECLMKENKIKNRNPRLICI